jgi:hypothetical protein
MTSKNAARRHSDDEVNPKIDCAEFQPGERADDWVSGAVR